MKRLIVAACLTPLALSAQQVRDSIITVSLNRSTSIAPDRGISYIVLEGTGETPADANTRLETKMKTLNEAIKALAGTATVDKPVSYGVSLAQNQNGYPMPAVPTTYVSRSVMRLQVTRLEQLSAALASLIAAGANSVSPMTFESSSVDSARRERMAEVLSVARSDAQTLATALGGKLGALVDVSSSSNPSNPFGPNTQLYFDSRFSGNGSMAPNVVVTTSVTVRYRLLR